MPRQASKAHHPRVHHCQFGTSAICWKGFSSLSGLTRHINSAHTNPCNYLNALAPAAANDQDCTPCDEDGNDLPPNTPPPPYTSYTTPDASDWTPFNNRAASLHENAGQLPFANHDDAYGAIDAIPCGGEPWSSFSVRYSGELPEGEAPPWMLTPYDVHFCDPRTVLRNQLSNPDFKDEVDYTLLREYGPKNKRIWSNFMSGNWAWSQADLIAKDPLTHGAMFVPCILGSDKTTVSVATGQNEYYPLYLSLGNVHNNICHSHRNAVSIIAFLSIPKTDRQYADDPAFRKFHRQLFHSSLEAILEPLRPGMRTPEVTRCPDGHLRRVIYGLGPYIADYPEQVLLACIAQNWCARCTADRKDLNGEAGFRSHEHTRLLMETLDCETLWVGIVTGNPRVTRQQPVPHPQEPVPADPTNLPVKTSPKTPKTAQK
ncbi:hypothetical protein BYT27DRAFT_7252477 [Phlegmacium glaucopus]|nr:hypothetical protein BYT27DRAFT_7252477 [Phlegmacium glaucopus]